MPKIGLLFGKKKKNTVGTQLLMFIFGRYLPNFLRTFMFQVLHLLTYLVLGINYVIQSDQTDHSHLWNFMELQIDHFVGRLVLIRIQWWLTQYFQSTMIFFFLIEKEWFFLPQKLPCFVITYLFRLL